MLFDIKLSLEDIPFPAFAKDVNLNYIACNKFFLEISGLDSENDLIGKSDVHFIWGQQNPKHAYKYYSDDLTVVKNKTITVRIEPVVFYKQTVVTRTLKLPIFSESTNTIGVLIIFLDVSEDIKNKDIDSVIRSYEKMNVQRAYFNTLTKKIVHDIQSNLSTLNILTNYNKKQLGTNELQLLNNTVNKLTNTLNILLESQESVSNVISNIEDLDKQKPELPLSQQKKSTIILSLFIFTIIQEKLVEYKDLSYKVNIQFLINNETSYIPIFIDEIGLYRSLSNLLNNAIRATHSAINKTIVIAIEAKHYDKISIIIKNNGDKIPQEVLDYVNYNASIPYKSIINQGIGLKQVKEMAKKNKGSVFAQTNEQNEGCVIELCFPYASTSASWLTQNLQISSNQLIILLYNSNEVLKAFKTKIESFIQQRDISTQVAYFKDASNLIYCIANAKKSLKNGILLFIETDSADKIYNFDELINHINIKNIHLITTAYQYKRPNISLSKNIKILPKIFIEDLYLYSDTEILTMNKNTPDLIIIDDDKNFLYVMSNYFFTDKKIVTYEDPAEFTSKIEEYTLNTIICIDNGLRSMNGLEFAKNLYMKGFTRLFILTGSNKEDINAPNYITVLNKLHDLSLLKSLIS